MKKSRLVTSIVVVLALTCIETSPNFASETGQPSTRRVKFDEAIETSRLTGRPIVLVFTGSDWCGWCHRLSREVFDTPQFASWSKDRVILVEADFPRTHQLPSEIAQTNQRLATKFSIASYPTVLMIDSREQLLLRIKYKAGGAVAWISKVQPYLPDHSRIVKK